MTGWFAEALMASTLLMALVMMLRKPAGRMFGARVVYLLWALPVLRLILPPIPEGSGLPADLGHGALIVFHQQAAPAVSAAAGWPWAEMAIAFWAGGVALFALMQVIGYIRFRHMLLSDGVVIAREGRITIIESAHASGPLAFGVWRKYVALPVDFADRYDAEERTLALAHECAHHDRGDLAANMAALGVLALHWCNPLAWIAYRAFRADQELACDALVMARHKDASPAAYGRAILKAASGRHFAAACHLRTVDNLKGRLRMLASHSASLHRISWGMAVIAAVTITGLALTASGSGAARQMAQVSRTMSDAKLVKLASFMPAATTRPVAIEAPKAGEAVIAPEAPTAPEAATAPEPAPPSPVMASVPPMAPVAPSAPDLSNAPSAREIAAMIPRIDILPECGQDGPVTTRTTTGANGRAKQVQIMICERAMAGARREARMAEAEARRGEIAGRQAALAGLRRARVGVARAEGSRDRAMSATIRAHVVADLDQEIARLEQGID